MSIIRHLRSCWPRGGLAAEGDLDVQLDPTGGDRLVRGGDLHRPSGTSRTRRAFTVAPDRRATWERARSSWRARRSLTDFPMRRILDVAEKAWAPMRKHRAP